MYILVLFLHSCSSQKSQQENRLCRPVEPHATSKIKVHDKNYDLKIWKEKNYNYQFAFSDSNVDFENLLNEINKPQLFSKDIAITIFYVNKYLAAKDEIKKENIIGIGIYKLYSEIYQFSFYNIVNDAIYPIRELNCRASHLSSSDVHDIYSLFYTNYPTVTALVFKEKSIPTINNKKKSHNLRANINFLMPKHTSSTGNSKTTRNLAQ